MQDIVIKGTILRSTKCPHDVSSYSKTSNRNFLKNIFSNTPPSLVTQPTPPSWSVDKQSKILVEIFIEMKQVASIAANNNSTPTHLRHPNNLGR